LEGLVGTPASTFYLGSMASISSVCVKVLEALDHAHSRGIVHLDVSPCNIIVRQDVDGSMQAQLVDWGIALAIGNVLTKFCGKSHFAHDDLHGLKGGVVMSLTLVAEYDLAALVYSMAEIVFESQSTSERRGSEQGSESSDDSYFERSLKREQRMFPWNLNADTDEDVFEARRIVAEKNLAKLELDTSYQMRLLKSLESLEDVDSEMESENEGKSEDEGEGESS
jgi:serine/threonine protein kinase